MRSSISVHITLVVIGLLLCARTGECESKRRPKRSSSSDREKLSSHGRKSFFVDPSTSLQCQASDMVVENSVMIDSKSSLASGAKFLQVEKVNFDGKSTSLVQLQESCSKICCDYEENVCDTALLSLVIGEVGGVSHCSTNLWTLKLPLFDFQRKVIDAIYSDAMKSAYL